MVVEDDRRREHHVARSSRPDQHREGPFVRAAPHRFSGVIGRIERRDERAVVDGEHRVHGHERVPQDLVAASARLAPGGRVLDLHGQLDQGPRAVGPRGRDPRAAVDGLAGAHQPPPHASIGGLDRLGVLPFGQMKRLLEAGRGQGEDGEGADVDDLLDGLVPSDVEDAVDLQACGRHEPLAAGERLDGAPLHLETAQADVQHRLGTGVDHAFGAHAPSLRVVGRAIAARGQHAELPSLLVLARRGAVRVEHVALVEHGVGHRPRRGEPIGRRTRAVLGPHDTSFPACWSSCSNVSSQVGRARATLNRRRASSVSASSRIQPLWGK